MSQDLMSLDATAQAALIRTRESSPTELVEAAIAGIEKLNPQLNAVVIPLFEKAQAEARVPSSGPFYGVPYLLKDLVLSSKGDLTSNAISGVKESGYRASFDSFFVERMRQAGFVLIGKTNTPEMGMSAVSTESAAWGVTRNPWDPSRSTAGSSGGSAAAVAAGMVAVAHGTDAVGSLRLPASHCGVVGLKGSRGRVSAGPGLPFSVFSALAEHMCLGRTVRDVAAVLDVVQGRQPGDPYSAPPPARPFATEVGADPGRVRIGLLDADPTGRVSVDPACRDAAHATAEVLADLGHAVVNDFPAALRDGGFPEPLMIALSVETKRELDGWGERIGRPLTEADVGPATWAIGQMGSSVSAAQYAEGIDSLHVRGREIERWWEDEGWDLLLTPTMPMTPRPLGSPADADPATFTVAFNVSGQPAISLPVHSDDEGLPVGAQLVAGYGREDLLLRLASQLELAMPWADRQPAVAI